MQPMTNLLLAHVPASRTDNAAPHWDRIKPEPPPRADLDWLRHMDIVPLKEGVVLVRWTVHYGVELLAFRPRSGSTILAPSPLQIPDYSALLAAAGYFVAADDDFSHAK